jgi:hypothetical protein
MPSDNKSGMTETKEQSHEADKFSSEQGQATTSMSEPSITQEEGEPKLQPTKEQSRRADEPSTVQVQATASVSEPFITQALYQFRSALVLLAQSPTPPMIHHEIASSGVGSFFSKRLFGSWRPYENLTYDELVAKYVSLWSVLEKPELQHYSMQALLGIQFLLRGRLKTSTQIFSEIEFQTSTPAALSYLMNGVRRFVGVLVVLTGAVVYSLMIPNFFLKAGAKSFTFFQDTQVFNITIAAICGMLGSVISLLLRLGEFEKTRGRSQMFLLLTGATLPLVGGVFGAFVAALLSAKIINISVGTEELNVWLYVVIGFLSGFSERFSRGFIQIAEDRLGGTSQTSRPGTVDGQKQAEVSITAPVNLG